MKIHPQDDLVLVEYLKRKTITPQGIHLPENSAPDLIFGKVIEVGQGAPTAAGVRIPHSVKPHDTVMMSSRGACFPVEYGNIFSTSKKGKGTLPKLALVPRDSIMAVVVLEDGESLGSPLDIDIEVPSVVVGVNGAA